MIGILNDYENREQEIEDLKLKLEDEKNVEILAIYRKLKMLNYVRMKLIEDIHKKCK